MSLVWRNFWLRSVHKHGSLSLQDRFSERSWFSNVDMAVSLLPSFPPVIQSFPTSAFSSLSKAPCSEAELRLHSCPPSSLRPIPLAPRDPKRWSWSWWRSRTVFSSPPLPSSHRLARLTRPERNEKPGPRKLTSCCPSSASQWTSLTSGGSLICATRMEEVRGEHLEHFYFHFFGKLWSF